MLIHWQRNRQCADRAEVVLWPLEPLIVQFLVLELCHTLLTCPLVLPAVGPLAVHAAVLDEAAGRAVLSLTVPLDSAPQLAQHSIATTSLILVGGRAVRRNTGAGVPRVKAPRSLVYHSLEAHTQPRQVSRHQAPRWQRTFNSLLLFSSFGVCSRSSQS